MTALRALRRRVTLEAPVDQPDAIGGATRSWTPLATLWAALQPVKADERREGDRMEQATTHRVILRWRAGITADMRFRLGARLFAIRGCFDLDERRRTLVCFCEEVRP